MSILVVASKPRATLALAAAFLVGAFVASAVLYKDARTCWNAAAEAYRNGRVQYARHLADLGWFCIAENGVRFPARYDHSAEGTRIACHDEDRP